MLSTKSSLPVWPYSGAVRQTDRHDGADKPAARGKALAQAEHGADRDGKDHVHRVLAHDRGENAGGRRDDVAHGQRRAADLAVDRRADLGVVEIDLRLLQRRLGAFDLRLKRLLARKRRVDARLLAGGRVEKLLGAAQRHRGIDELRLEIVDRRLLCRDVGLERRLLEPVEQVALLDLGALVEGALLDEGGDARDQVHAVGRLDAADEFERRAHRLRRDRGDADRGRAAGTRLLRRRGQRRGERQEQRQDGRGTCHPCDISPRRSNNCSLRATIIV